MFLLPVFWTPELSVYAELDASCPLLPYPSGPTAHRVARSPTSSTLVLFPALVKPKFQLHLTAAPPVPPRLSSMADTEKEPRCAAVTSRGFRGQLSVPVPTADILVFSTFINTPLLSPSSQETISAIHLQRKQRPSRGTLFLLSRLPPGRVPLSSSLQCQGSRGTLPA